MFEQEIVFLVMHIFLLEVIPLFISMSPAGKALDDLNMEDFDITSIDRELDRERDNDTNSVSSSLSAGLPSSGTYPASGPIGIPLGTLQQQRSISSLSQSPPSPFGSLPHSNPLHLHRDAPYDQVSSICQSYFQLQASVAPSVSFQHAWHRNWRSAKAWFV